ncbi:2-C-methyl-D-erythritol 2,4-cyclodiphosphate synthase [Phycisphaera mikurensis]|uniref:2-C-methyl-D-erythritol 2,4-cyclodiphosphate synthase n=1 Tax=Phycisphaera mikurensis (strain NBRC 102666 / KCTC 22515 / FYK2301M01) TaxID=1142394 RepID=I0IF69_PHYMF|nr:2-C-methyl-D-erythritol 2,4-cyclodiphosphate synthase [Phycisphaera mikurensis]MBB6440697.1 2-C-methyl-D-erythritol 2,4-cyclodiphosphate synthase [Phycisphaera mikurensis]BAM03907.1 2-C-methyl-D-erythritol 2,4-cyclodiphosphate synthase [Phycisphaera mikurensis NBRC 102666]
MALSPDDPQTRPPPFRTGSGWDLHRLEPGLPLVLAGVEVPSDRGCVAHSDGDAVFHAVTDALLGSLALGDIGRLFPDDDPANAGRDSGDFLDEAVRRVQAAGYAVVNLDVTVVLQKPRLGPHAGAMRAQLAARLLVGLDRVSLKAKTHEGVDAVGEGRAVSCQAAVLVTRAAPA